MTEGIIFSNLHDDAIPELTKVRTMASLPFACRYRLIDFPLSNMVNSGINSVYVVTTRNYQSLLDHVGSGKDWDLARRSGGLKVMTPYMSAFAGTGIARFNSRMEYDQRLRGSFRLRRYLQHQYQRYDRTARKNGRGYHRSR